MRKLSIVKPRTALFIVVVLVLLAAPLATAAQKSEKVARVGILGIGPAPTPQELAKSVATNPFWLAMRQLGWVDGQNMAVERRFGESPDQLRRGAAELVGLTMISFQSASSCSERSRRTLPGSRSF